ncbi:hypothetical protein [Bdellovibrio sp. HCB337]|uniref:hypothetical protein n=1 Tax=Bdellovibrio sp. HCB337 TaxID=3394358 RepID=UPI0039A44E2C
MGKFLSFILYAFVMTWAFTPIANAQVWTSVNTWSEGWEDHYAKWVQENWTADFFSRERLPNGQANPYFGLRTDCADTVYSMRLIFAYENRLPFAMQDPTTTSRLITSNMKRWNRTSDEIQRVRKFLLYIYDLGSTKSLPNDTFPIPVTRDWVRSGALIRTTQLNHHSWTIKEIQAIGVPHLVFNSTIGSSSGSELQERVSWPNPYWVFEGNFTPASEAGFRGWRPINYITRPVWETPNYSEEQFQIPLSKWQKTVQKKLALRQEGDDQMLRRLATTACEAAKTRIASVKEGVQFLRSLSTTCMTAEDYDTYSTPSRDQRLFDDMVALRRAYKDILKTNNGNSISEDMKNQMDKIFPYIQKSARGETDRMPVSRIDEDSYCVITYDVGQRIDFAEAKRRLFAGLMSNNPLDEMEYRWGARQGPSPRAQVCPSWDVWKPDLKQAD